MAIIDTSGIAMPRPQVIGATRLDTSDPAQVVLLSAQIRAEADVPLIDPIPGSFTLGWKLGFIQLEYGETNYAVYRGRQESHGSTRSTSSRRFLVRDTDEHMPDIWYDPPRGGVVGGRGTHVLRATTRIPPSRRLVTHVMMDDAPQQPFSTRITNGSTGFFNFLHHMESTFMFCTILTAEHPDGHFQFLKHFYWNLDFEAFFRVNGAGHVEVDHVVRQSVNVQHAVQNGPAQDHRFRGRELDRSLKIANNFNTHDRFSRNWNTSD